MWDLPPNTPDNYVQQDKLNNIPIEHKLEKYPQISKKVWDVVFEVKNDVIKIVRKAEISWNTQNETKELKEELIKKVEIILTPEEIEIVWWEMIAIFRWNILVRYEIWDNFIIDVKNIDINNDFSTLLSKKVTWIYFERKENWEIIFHRWSDKPFTQNNNDFHKAFYIDFWRLKKPIK